MTKPSRFFEKGRTAAWGGSLWVERADSNENRTRASVLTEPSVATQRVASASPRRMASTPSWMAVAADAHEGESEIGEPLVPIFWGRGSATEPKRNRRWYWANLPPPLTRSMAS